MTNGIKNEAFPYNLWYTNDYDLIKRFGYSHDLVFTNIIIAHCVSIDTEKRPDYETLIEIIDNYLKDDSNIDDLELELKVRLSDERLIAKADEVRAKSLLLLNLIEDDLLSELNVFLDRYKTNELIKQFHQQYLKSYQGRDYQNKHKIENNPASYIFSMSYQNVYIDISYQPYNSNSDVFDYELPRVSCHYIVRNKGKDDSGLYMLCGYVEGTIMCLQVTQPKNYNRKIMTEWLNNLLKSHIGEL